MPHVVLEGPITIEDIWIAYAPLNHKEEGFRFKTEECYLAHDKTSLLIRALVVERGYAKKFFTIITQKEKAITIKFENLTDPEKTDASRRLLGWIADLILASVPEARVTRSNIREFIHNLE